MWKQKTYIYNTHIKWFLRNVAVQHVLLITVNRKGAVRYRRVKTGRCGISEGLDSNLADLGTCLFKQNGRYLRWPRVEPGPLKQVDRGRHLVLATRKRRPCRYIESRPTCTFRLPWLRVWSAFFLSCKANARVLHAKTGHGQHCYHVR